MVYFIQGISFFSAKYLKMEAPNETNNEFRFFYIFLLILLFQFYYGFHIVWKNDG